MLLIIYLIYNILVKENRKIVCMQWQRKSSIYFAALCSYLHKLTISILIQQNANILIKENLLFTSLSMDFFVKIIMREI